MSPIVRNVLAVLAGVILGGALNMLIIVFGGSLILPPEGVDPSNMESIKANIHLYDFQHFIVPFLAHALGTLAGAFVTVKIAASRKMPLALFIGFWFMLGGVATAYMLGGPAWMSVVDVLFAYIPMAWIGYLLARK